MLNDRLAVQYTPRMLHLAITSTVRHSTVLLLCAALVHLAIVSTICHSTVLLCAALVHLVTASTYQHSTFLIHLTSTPGHSVYLPA